MHKASRTSKLMSWIIHPSPHWSSLGGDWVSECVCVCRRPFLNGWQNCVYRVNMRWRGDEWESGEQINHLTSGWSVHLCLGDRLQIGCDIQRHWGGAWYHTLFSLRHSPMFRETHNKSVFMYKHQRDPTYCTINNKKLSCHKELLILTWTLLDIIQ